MSGLINIIKGKFEKIKNYLIRNKPTVTDSQSMKIMIKSRNDSVQIDNQNTEIVNIPKISIHGINQRTSIASGTNAYRSEVDVQQRNLGRGITVKKQRKPGVCSQCRTPGKVVENTAGGGRWRCEECGSIFN